MKLTRARLNSIYLFTITIFFLLVAGTCIYFLLADYDRLITAVLSGVKKNGLENKIRNEFFSRQRFQLLQHIIYGFLPVVFLFYVLGVRYRGRAINLLDFCIESVIQCIKSVKQVFKNNSSRQNKQFFAFLIVIILFSAYNMTIAFLNYDEMWSYNYYTANHFYYSFFTYSNYPLFEMTTHFFKWLPFSMKINLRLSPFLFGIASCFLLYACLRKYFASHFTAMAGLIIFALMPVTTIYMVTARGAIHELFFAIAGVFSFLFWVNNTGQKKFLVIYFFAAVLGVYAIPTHFLLLFLLLIVQVALMIKQSKPQIFIFLKLNLFILLTAVVMYAPIFLTTGITIVSNIITAKPAYSDILLGLPKYVRDLLLYYEGYGYSGFILLIAAFAFLFLIRRTISKKNQLVLFIAAGLFLTIIFFYVVIGLQYPGRSVPFAALMLPLLAGLLAQLAELKIEISNNWKYTTGIGASIFLLLVNSYCCPRIIPFDKNVEAVSQVLLANNITSCYDNSQHASRFYYYYPGIEYYYRVKHRTIEFTLSAANSMRYKPLGAEQYDCIVYDAGVTDSSRLSSYHELYGDSPGKFKIWIRNNINKKP